MDDEALPDAAAANPFRLPRLHPGIGRAAGDAASRTAAQKPSVRPRTREQRDWFHKLGSILDELPKRLQLRVKAALREVMYSETRAQVREAVRRFAVEYGPQYPEALMTLEKGADVLLTFFDFPAEHWKHLRTSNVVEPPFATVRLRQRVTKGTGSRTKGLLMAYKLLAMPQVRWRRLDGAHHLPLVRADSPRETRAADRWRVGRTVPSIILSPA
jgi:putative transposase